MTPIVTNGLTKCQLYNADVIYDQAYNSFHEKLQSLQYNACLAITGAIRGIL